MSSMQGSSAIRATGRVNDGTKVAWGPGVGGDGMLPGEDVAEQAGLADRVLTTGPFRAGAASVRRHPRFIDACLYAGFLALLTYCVIKAQDQPGVWPSSAPFHSATVLTARYSSKFIQIDSITKWFDYVADDLLDTIYPIGWYNGEKIAKDEVGMVGAAGSAVGAAGLGKSFPDNFRIVGAVQVRQVRTQKATCPTTFAAEMRQLVLSCVGEYSAFTQDEAAFGPAEAPDKYVFSTKKENGENSYRGIFSSYDGGGFVVNLPADGQNETRTKNLAKILEMKKHKWIDRQTRAVFVTINFFNPGTGYITAMKLILEHPATGGLHPTVSLRHVPIGALYAKHAKLSTLVPEILLFLSVFAYMAWEFNTASTMSFAEYFSHFWGIYDWVNFSLYIVAYSFRWAAYDKAKLLQFPPANEAFVNFEPSAWHVMMWRNVLAVNLIVCYLKLFKYIQQIPPLQHIFKKIFFTMTDVLYLILSFAFIFWGFALSHFLAYGDEVKSFRTIPDSMISLWRQMLGDLSSVDAMIYSNRLLGPLFFVVFTSTVTILLLTVFLGLLRESYVVADDQNNRVTLLQAFLDSAIAPYLGLVKNYQLGHEEVEAAMDALTAQEALAAQVEKDSDIDKSLKGWDPEHVQARADEARARRQGRRDILLQSLLTLGREARVISRRVDTLVDSEAPDASQLPGFFD